MTGQTESFVDDAPLPRTWAELAERTRKLDTECETALTRGEACGALGAQMSGHGARGAVIAIARAGDGSASPRIFDRAATTSWRRAPDPIRRKALL